jgi:hypothetical protein
VADLRLWAGVALLVVSTVVGAAVLSSGDDTVTVWRAGHDLSTGSAPSGLEAVAVSRVVAGDRYAGPGTDLAGVLRWPVAAGELLPRAALAMPSDRPTRQVTVPVDPLHAPPGLQPGDLVDMWSTSRDAGTSGATVGSSPVLVLAQVTVTGIAASDVGINGEVGVVLQVPIDSTGDVVAASRGGVTDLVAVPLSSQEPGP